MPNKLNLSGRFGRLTIVSEAGRDRHGAVMWLCACDCGGETLVRAAQLRSGVTASCGCGIALYAAQPKTHGATGTPLYLRWRAMLGRCFLKGRHEYANYGGRGRFPRACQMACCWSSPSPTPTRPRGGDARPLAD